MLTILALERQKQVDPGAHWPTSLPYLINSTPIRDTASINTVSSTQVTPTVDFWVPNACVCKHTRKYTKEIIVIRVERILWSACLTSMMTWIWSPEPSKIWPQKHTHLWSFCWGEQDRGIQPGYQNQRPLGSLRPCLIIRWLILILLIPSLRRQKQADLCE